MTWRMLLAPVKTRIALTVGLLCLWAAACSSKTNPPTPPDPVDAGPPDAGRVCLDDTPDAGNADAGLADGGGDAGPDLSCQGRAAPTGGQAVLVLRGTVTTAGFTRNPREGITVELVQGGAVVGSAISDDAGAWVVSAPGGCAPFDGFLRTDTAPDSGLFNAHYVPDRPWRYDRGGLELVLFDDTMRTLVGAIAGVTVRPGTGVIALSVDDCAGAGMGGVVFSTADAGTVRYVNAGGLPEAALTSTAASGQALIFNLAPGTATITATLGGATISQRDIPVHADTVTTTTLGAR